MQNLEYSFAIVRGKLKWGDQRTLAMDRSILMSDHSLISQKCVSLIILPNPKTVQNIAKVIGDLGVKVLLVGGCVRDSLLGITSKDIDMEVYGLDANVVESISTSIG